MSEIKKLDEQSLENVVGGARKIVQNNIPGYDYANLRAEPNGKEIGKIYNGEYVYTTGRRVKRGDYTWLEIDFAGGHGWVAENLLVDISL